MIKDIAVMAVALLSVVAFFTAFPGKKKR